MNITEANDVNALLDYFLGVHAVDGTRALDAAVRLADRAHKAVSAGWTGAEVVEAFELLDLPGCYGCPDCDCGGDEPGRPVEDVPDPARRLS